MRTPSISCPLIRILSTAVDGGSVELLRRAHSRAIILGLPRDVPLFTAALLSAYSRLGFPSLASLVFFSTPQNQSDLLLWNSLLASYLRNHLFHYPLSLFRELLFHVSPDHFTLSIVAKSGAELRCLQFGRSLHSMVLKLGFCSDTVLSNSIMGLYLKCNEFGDARRLFDDMHLRSVASWNLLISEIVESGDSVNRKDVWKLIVQMQVEGMKPDSFTVSVILPVCDERHGREIHGFVMRHGYMLDVHVVSCLIGMYSRNKKLGLARWLFDQTVAKNVVVWTGMISDYVEDGSFDEALKLFREMQLRDKVRPNSITLVSVLPAVGSLAILSVGKQIHGFATRMGLLNDAVSLNNALIDMYSKCGSLHYAKQVFEDNKCQKDAISWSSMLACYGTHGRTREAILLFRKMCSLGVPLDHISSIGVLSACGKAGFVSEGIELYNSLVHDHSVSPSMEMCCCMVDMLGRAGRLNEAVDFVNSMRLLPSPSVWGTLFVNAVVHNDEKIQDLAYKSLMQSEPENPSNYVSISNLHALSGRWDSVEDVRKQMRERGLGKTPGCSWITVNSGTHSFFVADKSHHCSDMIYGTLNNLLLAMGEVTSDLDLDVV